MSTNSLIKEIGSNVSGVASSVSYVGRFAPSPTGPLHFGSAVAALASFAQARSRRGRWTVRIEDIDPPREQPGASAAILNALTALGLEWDGPVRYQSQRAAAYDEALATLDTAGWTFGCACTRKQLGAGPYPGTCRNGVAAGKIARSIRVRVDAEEIEFEDKLHGSFKQDLRRKVGDFIVLRSDGLYSYHLAVVVDDAADGITEIVRGADLIDSTPRQIYLQSILGLVTPAYVHIPLVLDDKGTKLSKQAFADPIDVRAAPRVLIEALRFLQQHPPPELLDGSADEIVAWAVTHWDIHALAQPSTQQAADQAVKAARNSA